MIYVDRCIRQYYFIIIDISVNYKEQVMITSIKSKLLFFMY